ncbi:MAG: DUF4438 domain-containing protein [Armatimonadetes bacterium]|nr:DUF4438 domain-containing protein [Armatimonadota bacterium]
MLRTNHDRLVKMAVAGDIAPATMGRGPHKMKAGGEAYVPIGMAGIIYNARPGCAAFHWEADHLEPSVCIDCKDGGEHHALHYLGNLGNDAVIVTGDAIGARGVLLGEHARPIVDFPPEAMEKMMPGDKVQLTAWGTGLELLDYPHIQVRKLDPRLLDKMGIVELGNGKIRVPVTHILPSKVMGSGWELNPEYVDQDMCATDEATVRDLGLESLRICDVVAVMDVDHTIGRGYKKGGVVIGLVNHGNSWSIGHGPGCMTLLSCAEPMIEPVIDPNANIAKYLNAGAFA